MAGLCGDVCGRRWSSPILKAAITTLEGGRDGLRCRLLAHGPAVPNQHLSGFFGQGAGQFLGSRLRRPPWGRAISPEFKIEHALHQLSHRRWQSSRADVHQPTGQQWPARSAAAPARTATLLQWGELVGAATCAADGPPRDRGPALRRLGAHRHRPDRVPRPPAQLGRPLGGGTRFRHDDADPLGRPARRPGLGQRAVGQQAGALFDGPHLCWPPAATCPTSLRSVAASRVRRRRPPPRACLWTRV